MKLGISSNTWAYLDYKNKAKRGNRLLYGATERTN
jgi:hypothetical protein